jgi:two-component system sensor histidine kinase PhcS
MESFSLDDAVTTALRLTAHELGTIAVNRDGVKDQIGLGTKTQIVHVLMNLLVNSAHALKDKSLGRTPAIIVAAERKNDRMEISIRDNGCGVKQKDLSRLLEPFFTTKQPGEGTGLGLSICHTIVKNHGGDVRIASEEGQWTQVTFDLPAPQAQKAAA